MAERPPTHTPPQGDPDYDPARGERLREARERRGRTVEHLARELGVTPEEIERREAGGSAPQLSMLGSKGRRQLEFALWEPMSWILTGEEHPGVYIARARSKRRWDRAQLAKKADLAVHVKRPYGKSEIRQSSTMDAIENGSRPLSKVSPKTLRKIARALGVKEDYLWQGNRDALGDWAHDIARPEPEPEPEPDDEDDEDVDDDRRAVSRPFSELGWVIEALNGLRQEMDERFAETATASSTEELAGQVAELRRRVALLESSASDAQSRTAPASRDRRPEEG